MLIAGPTPLGPFRLWALHRGGHRPFTTISTTNPPAGRCGGPLRRAPGVVCGHQPVDAPIS